MKRLVVEDLFLSFDEGPVLKGVDLQVEPGELWAILGPSGCGKTTLLRAIAGFLRPQRGRIWIGEQEVFGPSVWLPPEKRRVGYVPQEGALFPHLTVADNIAFGLPKMLWCQTRVQRMVELVGLSGLEKKRPAELSGGQQQRVAVARALAPWPSLVLLDEPFNALDAGLRRTVREDVRQALKATGATAILVTHDQEEAFSWADRVAVMRSGWVVQTGDPAFLYRHPRDLETALFLGERTVLPGTREGDHVRTPLGPLPIDPRSPARQREVLAVLRPEQVQLKPGHQGKLLRAQYFGHDLLLEAELPGGLKLISRVLGASSLSSGDPIQVEVLGAVMVYDKEAAGSAPVAQADRAGAS
ncbi:MAG: ABC transporter ATP-binding protein [Bacillota bacterium]|nr:ABC transporter ATP-binding protein [Bacillota bacterium]